MRALIVGRLLRAPVTLLIISAIVFVLMHAAPGDPESFYLGRQHRELSPAALAEFRHARGLDRPLAAQYLYWLASASRLEFGRSFVDGEPVRAKIAVALPRTLTLNLAALTLAALIGIPLGLMLGSRRRSILREGTHAVFLVLFALPTFWVALLLMRIVAIEWHLLPLYGVESDDAAGGLAAVIDRLQHLVLPSICLALTQIAIIGRLTSNAVEESLEENHIRAARARGIPERSILFRHAMRTAWIPLISLGGVIVPAMLSGSVVIERLFQWPGLGAVLFAAVLARDYPVVMGVTLVTATGVLLITIAVDVLYAIADPRLRESGP